MRCLYGGLMLFALMMPCMLHLHAPDGSELFIETLNIAAARPVTPSIAKQVAHGSRTIIYSAGGRYGIMETMQQIADMARQCEPGERR